MARSATRRQHHPLASQIKSQAPVKRTKDLLDLDLEGDANADALLASSSGG